MLCVFVSANRAFETSFLQAKRSTLRTESLPGATCFRGYSSKGRAIFLFEEKTEYCLHNLLFKKKTLCKLER